MKNLLPMRKSAQTSILFAHTHVKLSFVQIHQFLSYIQPLIDFTGHNGLQLVFLCEASGFVSIASILGSYEVSSGQLRRDLLLRLHLIKHSIKLTCTWFKIIMLNLYPTNVDKRTATVRSRKFIQRRLPAA